MGEYRIKSETRLNYKHEEYTVYTPQRKILGLFWSDMVVSWHYEYGITETEEYDVALKVITDFKIRSEFKPTITYEEIG